MPRYFDVFTTTIIMYLSNSNKNIISNREYIFNEGFKYNIKSIYKKSTLKKIYANFFIEFWELPEIQKNKELILRTFIKYEPFRKSIIHKSIVHDDVDLFDMCIDLNKKNLENIVKKIDKFKAWNIFIYSKHSEIRSKNNIQPYFHLIMISNMKNENKDPMDIVSTDWFANKYFFRLQDVYEYYEYNINLQYVQTELDKSISTSNVSKYWFHMDSRNILKFILKHKNKLTDTEIHKFLLAQNNTSLLYEYFTLEELQNNDFQEFILNSFKSKIRKGKNIINTLFQYKNLFILLYESDPSLLFKYLINNYEKLWDAITNFLMETVFNENHRKIFYETISTRSKGHLSIKARKEIYSTIKEKKPNISPSLPLFKKIMQ